MNKQELLDFFNYLDRRGFLREDLQCNPEHHVEVYLRDFCKDDKPNMTDEQKASQIAESKYPYDVNSDNCEHYDCYFSAMEMAKWKDKQFEIYTSCDWAKKKNQQDMEESL